MTFMSQHQSSCCSTGGGELWPGVCVSEPHLKTGNSEAAGVIGRRGHRDDEGAVWDVLVVEADGHLVVSCRGQSSEGH